MESTYLPRPLLCESLVGREAELARLTDALERADKGQPQLVLLAGEAGLGKSRLSRSLAEIAGQKKSLVLTGQSLAQNQSLAFGPFLDAFQHTLALLTEAELTPDNPVAEALALLLRLMPELEPVIPSIKPAALDNSGSLIQQQFRLFQGILNALQVLARAQSGPLLLLIEDIHWADETSLEFLAFLARQLGVNSTHPTGVESGRILIVTTYRPEAIPASPALSNFLITLNKQRQANLLTLAPLDPANHTRFLEVIFGQTVPEKFATRLYERDEGNPFFTEELLGAMAANGQIELQPEGQLKPFEQAMQLPLSLKASILERVALLTPVGQEALACASVIGREFDYELVLQLSKLDERELLLALRQAINLQLIVETGNDQAAFMSNSERFQFRHALTREAIYGDMLARERRIRHRQLAETLEQQASKEDRTNRLLAEQYALAGQPEKARPYALLAAEQARRLLAFREERRYLQIGLAELAENSPERLGMEHRLGLLSLAIGDIPVALEWLSRAKEGYQKCGQFRQAASILINLSFLYWFYQPARLSGLMEELEEAARECYEGAEPQNLEALAIYSQTAFSLASGDMNSRAQTWIERSFAIAATLADPAKGGALLFSLLAKGTVGVDGPAEGVKQSLAEIRQVLDSAIKYGLPDLALVCYGVLFTSLINLGESEQAEQLSRELVDYHTRSGTPRMSNLLGWQAFFSGVWDMATTELREEIKRATSPTIAALHGVSLAHLLISRNELDEALFQLKEATPQVENLQFAYRGPALWAWARLHTALKEYKAAEEFFEKVVALWKTTEDRTAIIPILLDGITFYAASQNPWKCRQWLSLLQTITQATSNRVALAAQLEAEGRLAAAEGDYLLAIARLRQAAPAWEALKRPYLQAQVNLRLASLLLTHSEADKNSRQEAEALLEVAARLYEQLQLPEKLEEIEKLRQESRLAGQHKRRATLEKARNQFQGLTKREVQVLIQIAAGLTNKEISQSLSISESTVETHVNHILAKLECESRTQAAAFAVEQGWTKAAIAR